MVACVKIEKLARMIFMNPISWLKIRFEKSFKFLPRRPDAAFDALLFASEITETIEASLSAKQSGSDQQAPEIETCPYIPLASKLWLVRQTVHRPQRPLVLSLRSHDHGGKRKKKKTWHTCLFRHKNTNPHTDTEEAGEKTGVIFHRDANHRWIH